MLLIPTAAALGAAAGTLVPHAAYRLAVAPGEPWSARCPGGHPLGGAAAGWLARARCPACVPPRPYGRGTVLYPAAGALGCAALAAAVGPRPELAVWLLLFPFALVLAAVDARVHRLPDVLTLPLAAAVVCGLGAASVLPSAGGSWRGAVLGGGVLAGAYFLLFLVSPRGMGFGDVKLALALGPALGWYGWGVLLAGAFLGFLSAAAWGLVLLARGRAGRRTPLAFGPFMLLGGLLGVLAGGLASGVT